MLLRVLNMRGVDLQLFQFDYDLTWAAFLLDADGRVYHRFGGRDAESPDKYLTLSGLKHAMRTALAVHPNAVPSSRQGDVAEVKTVEQYPAARKLKADACIHCHQVYDFRRDLLLAQRKWSKEEAFVYPPPDNVGLKLNPERGDEVAEVRPDSPAARTGIQAGDVLRSVNGVAVASFADVQHALHLAPPKGKIAVVWERQGTARKGELELADGWRKSDISWRASMWGLPPIASVWGQDLSPEEKKALGLGPKRLAFRQGNFVPAPAHQAGVRANDVILGIDNKELEMTMLQFNAYVRLNHEIGDRITFNVLRNGKRLDLPMTLPGKAPF